MEEGSILIPGLPNDLAISCLIRVPRIHHLSLRAVNSQWRSLLLNPLSQFHTQRKQQALTNPSLFLLPISYDDPPNRLECTEIDLLSHKKSKTTFTNDSVNEMIFLEGHACISHDALVIVIGGFGPHRAAPNAEPSYRASKSVHIFNTLTKKWTLGADMLARRGEFAWGLIGNHLYVAGGFGGDNVGNLVAAEVYDFEANEWREVSSMPVSMTIDAFFVVSGKLFVRGWLRQRNAVEAYSYCPLTDVWEEDNWMLRVLEPVPRLTSNSFAVPADENGIYMLELSESFAVWGSMTERLYLNISKLNNETLEWVRVRQILDKAESDFCECPDAMTRHVPFHGLKDGVVVLCHHDTDPYSYSYNDGYGDSESENDSDNDHPEVEVSSVSDHIIKWTERNIHPESIPTRTLMPGKAMKGVKGDILTLNEVLQCVCLGYFSVMKEDSLSCSVIFSELSLYRWH